TLRMHQPKRPELILASSSPRRQELLREIGIPFQVHAANINEDQIAGEAPIAYALRLAQEKAQAVAEQYPQSYVLGADTIVVIDGEVLGKPQDHADAARMLRLARSRRRVPAQRKFTSVKLPKPRFSSMWPAVSQWTKPEHTLYKAALHAGPTASRGNFPMWWDCLCLW